MRAAIALRCEDGFSQLFPEALPQSMDALLEQQRRAAPKRAVAKASAHPAQGGETLNLPPGTPLDIALAFDTRARVSVGRLAWAQQTAQLEWSRDVIVKKLAVDAQLRYPHEGGLLPARTRYFDGLHGFLADSLPKVGVIW
ncbi:MAG: hypothetical protein WDN76_05370 [Alphaproteobacteria bacterium]